MSEYSCEKLIENNRENAFPFRITATDGSFEIDPDFFYAPSLISALNLPDRLTITVTEPKRPYEYIEESDPQEYKRLRGDRYVIIDSNNPNRKSVDGVVYNKDMTELIYCSKRRIQITIPDSVKVITESAFENCTKLKSIRLPDGLTSIECYAFGYCTKLASLYIPKTVKNIGYDAFCDCDDLTEIIVDDDNPCYSSRNGVLYTKDLSKMLYCNTRSEKFVISEGVRYFDFNSFKLCKGMKAVVIPSSVITIHYDGLFYKHCDDLADIIVDDRNMQYCSFDGVLYNKDLSELICCAKKKSSVSIPDGVRSIGLHGFGNNHKLRSVSLPKSIESICCGAFCCCTNLMSVALPDSIMNIEPYSFYNCKHLTSIEIPKGVEDLDSSAFGACYDLKELVVSMQNPYFSAADGMLFNKDMTKLIYCSSAKKNVIVPEGVKVIGRLAFNGSDNLNTIIIPDSVEKIDVEFLSCIRSLKSVSAPIRLIRVILDAIIADGY